MLVFGLFLFREEGIAVIGLTLHDIDSAAPTGVLSGKR